MKIEQVKEILDKIKYVKIAVYGDYCLDAYWMLDPRGSEISVETGLKGFAVSKQKYFLGGAANVIANLAALKPQKIKAIGVIGNDLFGRELVNLLKDLNVDTSGMVVQESDFDTIVYCKRILEGNEQQRIDFGIYNQRTKKSDEFVLRSLREAIADSDVIILNQQVPGSINNGLFIDGINTLLEEFPDKIVLLDSRHYGHRIKNVYRKINQTEAARLNNVDTISLDIITLSDMRNYINNLYQQSKKPVFLSRGARGIIVRDKNGTFEIPGIQLLHKVDPVGAGDTMLSAIACCLAAGIQALEAAEFANFAAAVTVQKLYQTGTASPDEIVHIATDPDYIYQPELAEDIRQASYYNDSEIELCYDLTSLSLAQVKHVIFDHDGTISSLRQGWEAIMEHVMIRAILGDQYETVDEAFYHKVRQRVLEYIDQSTGIQTILQMQALVEMVKEFNIVPPDKVLDKFGYKKVYNEGLMKMVNRRIARLKRSEFNVDDYTIKGAVPFLKMMRKQGLTLYLASGTDREDVEAEARALGYAELFNGGIYGAVGDVKKYSKKLVIEKILRENNLQGPALACFGDGPVEIRECRKKNGIAIGIASDEIRRYDLNSEKRTRLIKAGAHLIIPDFSQAKKLIEIIFNTRR